MMYQLIDPTTNNTLPEQITQKTFEGMSRATQRLYRQIRTQPGGQKERPAYEDVTPFPARTEQVNDSTFETVEDTPPAETEEPAPTEEKQQLEEFGGGEGGGGGATDDFGSESIQQEEQTQAQSESASESGSSDSSGSEGAD